MEELDPHALGDDQPCFGCAPQHPIGFQLRFWRDGDSVVTRFTPDERYQGPPGILHGGLVTTLADEIGVWTLIGLLQRFGFTAQLSGSLKKPARIGKEILGRGRIVRPGTRVVEVEVGLEQEDDQVFLGNFRFVILDRGGAEKLLGKELPENWARLAR